MAEAKKETDWKDNQWEDDQRAPAKAAFEKGKQSGKGKGGIWLPTKVGEKGSKKGKPIQGGAQPAEAAIKGKGKAKEGKGKGKKP